MAAVRATASSPSSLQCTVCPAIRGVLTYCIRGSPDGYPRIKTTRQIYFIFLNHHRRRTRYAINRSSLILHNFMLLFFNEECSSSPLLLEGAATSATITRDENVNTTNFSPSDHNLSPMVKVSRVKFRIIPILWEQREIYTAI